MWAAPCLLSSQHTDLHNPYSMWTHPLPLFRVTLCEHTDQPGAGDHHLASSLALGGGLMSRHSRASRPASRCSPTGRPPLGGRGLAMAPGDVRTVRSGPTVGGHVSCLCGRCPGQTAPCRSQLALPGSAPSLGAGRGCGKGPGAGVWRCFTLMAAALTSPPGPSPSSLHTLPLSSESSLRASPGTKGLKPSSPHPPTCPPQGSVLPAPRPQPTLPFSLTCSAMRARLSLRAYKLVTGVV